jgi:hypothetical protein
MSWLQARVLPLLMAATLWLTPGLAQAFAFDGQEGTSVVKNHTAGSPVIWDPPSVTMRLNLGSPGRTLLNGTTSWDTNAADALALWNTAVPHFFTFDTTAHNPCDAGNGFNTVAFAQDNCGEGFGDAVALTRKTYVLRAGGFVMKSADVMLNAQLCWNAYAGPLRPTLCAGTLSDVIDLQRVVLHELGHVLGLEHPDEAGQTVPALMNRYISDLDTLTPDDRLGAAFLYPQPALAASAAPDSRGGGGGGGCTLSPGSDVDPILGGVLLVLVGILVWKHIQTMDPNT